MIEFRSSTVTFIALCLLVINAVHLSHADSDNQDADEGSCICGLNKNILDQLERIVKQTSQSCDYKPDIKPTLGGNSQEEQKDSSNDRPSLEKPDKLSEEHHGHKDDDPKKDDPSHQSTFSVSGNHENEGEPQDKDPQSNGSNQSSTINGSNNSNNDVGDPGGSKRPTSEWDLIAKLTAEIHRLEGLMSYKPSSSNSATTTITSTSSSTSSHQKPSSSSSNGELQIEKPVVQPVNSGFLGGIEVSPIGDEQKANLSQAIKPEAVADVIETTIPNVVSNIFSNIQNLTLSTEFGMPSKPSNGEDSSAVLTSINGQTVNVQGDSSKEITAEGEKLFLAWIEQQLATLHVTAAMAKYIRNSALNLFRKIVKQYVERVEKMGGSIEVNVRKATQLALTNTQNLIRFLMKHYLYISAGLMQLIGESVSRVGKQLDQTGETIVHLSLNPFDIVSKVMESLPNPSDYSHYFRNLGKTLLGEMPWNHKDEQTTTPTTSNNNPSIDSVNQGIQVSSDDTKEQQPNNMNGLFKKTMGALSKTLSNLLG